MKGGLGNQLSILAAGLTWSRRGRCELFYDTSSYPRDVYYRCSFETAALCRALGVEAVAADGNEVRVGETLPLRLRFGLSQGTFLLAGYYQSPRNVGAAVPAIAAALAQQAEELGFVDHRLWREASSRSTVAVHFRRFHGVPFGGREPHPHLALLGPDYYRTALEHATCGIATPRILAFSDDPTWLDEQDWLNGHDWVNAENEVPAAASLFVLLLMARCRALVAANSTLSWWSGLLRHASDPSAVLVAPDMTNWEPSITLGREWRCVRTAVPAGLYVHSTLPQHLKPADLKQDF